MTPITAPPSPGAVGAANRWAVVALLLAGVLVNYVDRGNLSVAAVAVMRELDVDASRMGILLSAFFWTYALLQLPCGYVLDRFGLKRTYAVAFLLWSLASAATGIARNFEQVLVLRLVLGIGEAVVTPASITYIRRNFADHEQGLPTALFVGGMMLGPAAGTLIGGLLLDAIGWRSLFIWTGLLACAWLVPWMMIVREQPTGPSKDSKQRVPVPSFDVLHSGLFWCISVGALFYSYFWYFCLNWLPSYFLLARNLSPAQMAVATSVPLGIMAALSLVSGRAADRLIRRGSSPLRVRAAFTAAGFFGGACLFLLPVAPSAWQALTVLAISLGSVGVASANYWALTQAAVPAVLIGRAIGYQNTLGNLGGISAPLLSGILIGAYSGFFAPIWIAAAAILLAGVSYAILLWSHSALRPINLEGRNLT